jgi:hypothetical protein
MSFFSTLKCHTLTVSNSCNTSLKLTAPPLIFIVSRIDGQTIRAEMRPGQARGLNVASILKKWEPDSDLTTRLEEANFRLGLNT